MKPPPQATRLAAEEPFGEAQLQELADALAEQFERLYGAEPVDPRAVMAGDDVVGFFFGGALTRADESHLKAEHFEELRQFRDRFAEAVAEELKLVVTAMTGTRVTFFTSGFNPHSRTTSMLFTLDLFPHSGDEQREALRNWSEQVRRNARNLRTSHEQHRETHIALRKAMAKHLHDDEGDSERG